MTEREKIIETIRTSGYGYFITHDNADVEEVLAQTADALIAAGVGDVKEAKRKAFVYSKEISYLDNKLKETEHRAEVAERALLTACVNLIEDEEDNVNAELLARVVYTKALRKAKKEVMEEKNAKN